MIGYRLFACTRRLFAWFLIFTLFTFNFLDRLIRANSAFDILYLESIVDVSFICFKINLLREKITVCCYLTISIDLWRLKKCNKE